ncbi:MAG: hypothetical protein IKD21_05015 [Clostridia bacterium]|nr:hypothetical protein [Clostridia bacterium]
MFKRLLCLLLALSFCIIPFAVQAADVDSKEVTLLRDLDILEQPKEEGLYEDRFNYTKGQFAKALAMMVHYYEPPILQEQIALDIEDSEYMPYINFALSHGFMRVDNKNRFYPKADLDLTTVIYGLVTVLDYDILAQQQGGTEQAYMSVAAQIGLLRNVNIKNEDVISIPELAKMIMNAMKISPKVLPNEVVSPYKPTLFEQKDLQSHSGRVLANNNVGLIIEKCPKNYVNIDGKLYRTNLYIEDIVVGTVVTYYTQEIDGETYVVSVYADGDETIVSIDAEELEDISFKGSYIQLTYGEDETVKIDNTAFALINGKSVSLKKEYFNVFKSGNIKAIDSDENGTYDVVHMMLYKTEIVEGAGVSSNSIMTRYTNQSIQLSTAGENVAIYRDNIAIGLGDVASGNIINVACDAIDNTALMEGRLEFDYANAKRYTIHVSNKTASGVISQITSDNLIYIDGIDYQINEDLAARIEDGTKPKIRPGLAVVLYLDYYGKVIDLELDAAANAMQYGYLVEAAMNNQGLNKTMALRILNTEGSITIFEVAETYILNGASGTKSDKLTGLAGGVDLTQRQLIRYRVSGDLIREIDTTYVSTMETAASALSRDYQATTATAFRWDAFNYKCAVDSNTVIFQVPPVDKVSVEDKDFARFTKGSLKQDKEYILDAYDMDDLLYADCLVIYAEEVETAMTYKQYTYMIGDITRALNDDGVPATRIEVLGRTENQGEGVSRKLFLSEDVVVKDNHKFKYGGNAGATNRSDNDLLISDLKIGDAVRILQDNDNEITYIERVFTPPTTIEGEALTDLTLGKTGFGAFMVPYATVKDGIYQYICVSNTDDIANATAANYATFLVNFFRTVYIYNVDTKEITSTTNMTQLPTYKKAANARAFIHIGYSDISDVFVYQWD